MKWAGPGPLTEPGSQMAPHRPGGRVDLADLCGGQWCLTLPDFNPAAMNIPGLAFAAVAALLAVPCLPESVHASNPAGPFEPTLLASAGSVRGTVVGTPLSEPPGFSLRSLGVPSITNDGHV